MRVAGLFSGIGGLELPFRNRGASTSLLCDIWEDSRKVLGAHFPYTPIYGDIRELKSLPGEVDVVTAGFPCTDLSQAGRTAGIGGKESGLVSYVFDLLENKHVEWLVLENVRNTLVLDKGRAMFYLTSRLESMGFRWAYRLVDSRFTGVPQRRHRILLVASRHHDPREVLFADEAGEPDPSIFHDNAFGFYWTEGLRGLGWAMDSVPPLKGGSTVGIPSPPAIWIPDADLGYRIVTPSIDAAEELQGFTRGWTNPAQSALKNGPRWKLVGNAVTVGVADWLVNRLYEPGEVQIDSRNLSKTDRWPSAAYGESGKRWVFSASNWPVRKTYHHLLDLIKPTDMRPLSYRATAGFLDRAARSTLRFEPDFLLDLEEHMDFVSGGTTGSKVKRASLRSAIG